MEFELINPEQETFFSYAREQQRARAEQDPIVGDWVHFWTGETCWAAVVTQDDLHTVWLSCVAPGETSLRPVRDVEHDESKEQPSWHWPCGGQ